MYSPVTGAGDMATQYMTQYQSSQVYGDVGKYLKIFLFYGVGYFLLGYNRCYYYIKETKNGNNITVIFCYSNTMLRELYSILYNDLYGKRI